MPWVDQEAACGNLRISQRLLTRRIATGEVRSRREGHQILVFVPDNSPGSGSATPGLSFGTSATSPAAVSTATAVDFARATLTALNRARFVCEAAEHRAVRSVRRSVAAAALVCLAACASVLAISFGYYEEKMAHAQTQAQLDGKVAANERLSSTVEELSRRLVEGSQLPEDFVLARGRGALGAWTDSNADPQPDDKGPTTYQP